MKQKTDKTKQILDFLKRGEKTASEISIYIQTNYYKVKEMLLDLTKQGKIEIMEFRDKKYYKLKGGKIK